MFITEKFAVNREIRKLMGFVEYSIVNGEN